MTRSIGGGHARGLGRVLQQRSGGGFTLVEVLVALGIFVIGMAGVMALYAAAAKQAGDATRIQSATLLVDSLVEDMIANFSNRYRPSGYPRSLTGPPVDWESRNGGLQLPAQWQQIRIPSGWPGAIAGGGGAADAFSQRPTYSIRFEPLPATIDPASGTPTCVLATITVYLDDSARPLVYKRVIPHR